MRWGRLPLAFLGIVLGACDDAEETTTSSSSSSSTGGAEPTCCACSCADPTWSCSIETCLDASAQAVALVPEAGMLELPGGQYTSSRSSGDRLTPRRRVWYSFQPAETEPEKKPLVILFNGGPGTPSPGVLAFNTGHYTFDSEHTGGAPFAENPHRWSRTVE